MTDNDRYLFDLQGYLLIENALSKEQLGQLNAILDEQISKSVADTETTKRLGGLLTWGQPFVDLMDHERIMPYLNLACGRLPRLDHAYADIIRSGHSPIGATLHHGGTPFDVSTMYHVHKDQIFCGLVVVAYNLHDVNPGDGGFACIPGSHKSNFRTPPGWEQLDNPMPCVKSIPGPAGSAVMFTEALTHGPLPWRGRHERRTVFYKYTHASIAWAVRPKPDPLLDSPTLTPRQRSMLLPAGSEWAKEQHLKNQIARS